MNIHELKKLKSKIFENITVKKTDETKLLFERMEHVGQMPLDEIDREEWNDLAIMGKDSCLDKEELVDYLNWRVDFGQIKGTSKYKSQDYKQRKFKYPYIHTSVLKNPEGGQVTKEGGEIDVEAFIKDITTPPPNIVGYNKKAEKSETPYSVTYDFGVPALRAIVFDEDTKEFLILSTCPGAGDCVLFCYARKGMYVQMPAVFLKQTRVLNQTHE